MDRNKKHSAVTRHFAPTLESEAQRVEIPAHPSLALFYAMPIVSRALNYEILRYITINNAQLRYWAHHVFFTHYNEMSPASLLFASGELARLQASTLFPQAYTKPNKVRQTSEKNAQTNSVNKSGHGESDLEILPDAERGLTEETLKKITDAIRLF